VVRLATSLEETKLDRHMVVAKAGAPNGKVAASLPSTKAEDSPSSIQAARDARWAKLKRAVMAKSERRKLLVGIPLLQVAFFEKEYAEEDGKEVTTFGKLNQNLRPVFQSHTEGFCEKVQQVRVVRPALQEACEACEGEEVVDNTGLLRMYPSEEALAAFLLLHVEQLSGKRVLELGSGFCGLALLQVARNFPNVATKLMASDGNDLCVNLIQEHIRQNAVMQSMDTCKLVWDRHSSYKDKAQYDVIVVSDCLYLNKIHPDLINAIKHVLAPDGVCLVVSPTRYKSLEFFVNQAKECFHVIDTTPALERIVQPVRDRNSANFRPRLLQLYHLEVETTAPSFTTCPFSNIASAAITSVAPLEPTP